MLYYSVICASACVRVCVCVCVRVCIKRESEIFDKSCGFNLTPVLCQHVGAEPHQNSPVCLKEMERECEREKERKRQRDKERERQ